MRKHLPVVAAVVLLSSTATASAQQLDPAGSGAPAPLQAKGWTEVFYAPGAPAPLVGQLDAGDSTYNRVGDSTCSSVSTVGTAVPYDVVRITNSGTDIAQVVVTTSPVGGGACGDANNTFLTLHWSFMPIEPRRHCMAANDDIAGASNRCSTLSFSIAPGNFRYVVVSAAGNPPEGLFSYQLNFGGTTPVELLDFSVESSP